MRAAAVQFAVGTDVEANLGSCLRMTRNAARERAELVVLPEFCNHLSWYDDREHCMRVSVDVEGRFVRALAAAAREHRVHLVANVTLRRGEAVTGTSLLFSPEGSILGASDKQVLMGHENDFLRRATSPGPVVETPIGKLGMYSCMDGVVCETPRSLALRGAEILANSLNSFAPDEASLHVPVRAAENGVFVVAANKVGPLIPEKLLGPVSQATSIPERFLHGAGESQIVAPDGRVLARAPREGEAVVVADIDRREVTDVHAGRRPELYGPIADPVARAPALGAPEVQVTVVGRGQVDTLPFGDIVVLPPGSWRGERADVYVATVIDGTGVIVGPDGVALQQRPIHRGGDGEIATVDLPAGRVALVVGDDALYPELFRLLALRGVSLVLVCAESAPPWLTEIGLVERAAENRMCLAASAGVALLADLHEDFTIMTPWKSRVFDGKISEPIVTRGRERATAPLHPARADNKLLSHRTDLVDGRAWALAGAIVHRRAP